MNIDHYSRNNDENFVHLSKIPESCKLKKCVLGIDEAGRLVHNYIFDKSFVHLNVTNSCNLLLRYVLTLI